jgi:8-oxo-dGTP pyrophosphatase MutT (NUDIX family)
MEGCDNVILLSQYIGDFQPEAQVKGLLGCNFIALICNKNSATFCSVSLLLSMAQIYRIYINDSALIITENISVVEGDYQAIENQAFDFRSFYDRVKVEATPTSYVLHTSKAKLAFKGIKAQLVLIKAAGGLVENEEDKFLFIFRRGKWDLPKGKIDEYELTKTAAVREVEEECGIKVSEVSGKICKTYHIYEQRGQVILKKTTWYKMHARNQQELVPQLEEDITEARWLAPSEFDMVRQNTFPLILDVIRSEAY